MEKSRRGWGGCSGSGIAPNSGGSIRSVSPSKAAGDGRKRGDFVFRANCWDGGVLNTVFGHPVEFNRRLPLAFSRLRSHLLQMSDAADLQSVPGPVFFDRRELDLILRVYGRMVAAAEWRDYAMVGHRDVAEFAVFRRSGDAPLYRIEKRPALRLKQGQWAVIGEGGVVLRRGRELAQVLRVFDSRKFSIVE